MKSYIKGESVYTYLGEEIRKLGFGLMRLPQKDGAITVLSGMSSIGQMEDNLACMKDFKGLTAGQEEVLKRAQEELNKIPLIPCTSCNYCAKASCFQAF